DKRGKESFLIVSPSSDSVIPLINSLNLTLNEDYNVSLGYPLDRTPLFSFIKHLFDIFKTMKDDKVYIPDYLKFVLHPYTKNILLKNETELTRIVFHTLEERLAEESFINYRDLKELEDNEFLDKIHKQIKELISIQELKEFIKEIHKSTIYRFVNLNNLRDFTQKLKGLINFIYEKSTAKLHILFFPYCEAMLSALTDLESSLFSEEKLKSPVEYFDLFKKFISLYNVPFHGTPIKDIQVLGFLESRNLKFDNVYILDVNEGIIPSSEREDELLPFDVRKRLNVPTYVEKDILYEYYLNNIIAGAKKVSLFYVENENKERSRFIEKIIWEKQKNKGKIENFVTTISYNIKLTPYKPREIEKSDEVIGYLKNMTYSASSIDTYYNCQLMFYYQYVLMPQQTEGILESLEGKDVGNIIHDILREYYIVKSIDLDEKRLQEVIEKILINKFGTNLTGKLLILKYQIERQLKNFIGKYKENVKAKEVEIIELEKDFNPFEVYIENLGKIKIKGRIDRIEKRDGQIFVVDFKKSSNESRYKVRWDKFDLNKREEWQRSFKSIQLFFYIFLLDKSNNVVYKPDNGSYFLLEKKDLSQSEIMLFKDLNDKEDNFSNIDKIITKLIEEIILSPIFKPTENLETCKNCPYKDVCWQEDGKKLNL
ncbi:MAG: PD-(D/E)XK nuclease family protein, partial [Proteobacteria bacterium]|nr:PD-(D/E)XK nuclease family protein [Pseudomonadota bacterium]